MDGKCESYNFFQKSYNDTRYQVQNLYAVKIHSRFALLNYDKG